ncbi:hypothetical protein [Cytobacillus firmus]|uniref:hypothetical protein n=1 Tax=Cytobacillus firmus TaxID=1399 RepID=UPI001C8EC565|nr:hypothetical protein [Cytobacillus firmus]MBX9975135.1 hypothetical protein [Cytobacillus firmus]
MKKNLLIIIAIIITLFIADRFIRPGIESAGVGKVKEETRINSEELKVEDYEKIYLKAIKKAESYEIKDKELLRWVVKGIASREMDNKPELTKKALIRNAREQIQLDKANIEYAEVKYDIKATDQELEALAHEQLRHLTSDISLDGYLRAFAKTYDLSPKEVLLEIEKSSIMLMVTNEKLYPKLVEVYNSDDRAEVSRKYGSEVRSFMAGIEPEIDA